MSDERMGDYCFTCLHYLHNHDTETQPGSVLGCQYIIRIPAGHELPCPCQRFESSRKARKTGPPATSLGEEGPMTPPTLPKETPMESNTEKAPCQCGYNDVTGYLNAHEHFADCPHATRETVPEGYMRGLWDAEHGAEARPKE